MYKVGNLRMSVGLILIVLACANKPEEQRDCEYFTLEANKYFECYLHDRNDLCLMKSSQFVKVALLCDSLLPYNHWLNIKVLSAQNRFDSVLYAIERFEKILSGPDLMFTKGEVYRKLGNLDSARVCYEKALDRYDQLLKTDSQNSSLILGRLQTIIYLSGRQKMRQELEFYKSKYSHLQEFYFLEDVPIVLDSIP